MDIEKENWIKWLQARIPELKKSHNEYWLRLALDGYLESKKGDPKCSHVWVNNSYDHFGFVIEEVCDKCGLKQAL